MASARSVLAVILGYAVFAIPTYVFFRIVGQPPHAAAPIAVMVGSSAIGMASAAIGGYVAA